MGAEVSYGQEVPDQAPALSFALPHTPSPAGATTHGRIWLVGRDSVRVRTGDAAVEFAMGTQAVSMAVAVEYLALVKHLVPLWPEVPTRFPPEVPCRLAGEFSLDDGPNPPALLRKWVEDESGLVMVESLSRKQSFPRLFSPSGLPPHHHVLGLPKLSSDALAKAPGISPVGAYRMLFTWEGDPAGTWWIANPTTEGGSWVCSGGLGALTLVEAGADTKFEALAAAVTGLGHAQTFFVTGRTREFLEAGPRLPSENICIRERVRGVALELQIEHVAGAAWGVKLSLDGAQVQEGRLPPLTLCLLSGIMRGGISRAAEMEVGGTYGSRR